MQAVIALCHFCETHGPRVVFTSQPLQGLPYGEGPSNIDSLEWSNKDASFTSISNNLPVCEVDHPQLLKGALRDKESRCSACSSIGDKKAYLSIDKTTQTTFVSTQVAFDDLVEERVKYACLRSLTIEVGSNNKSFKRMSNKPPPKPGGSNDIIDSERIEEKDGNVFFGDAEHGYTMSLTFRIADCRARGFLRLYSLLVVSSQMQFILHNHDSFLSYLTMIKKRLQDGAQSIFASEMDVDGRMSNMRPENASRANLMPQGWFKRKMNVDPVRDLRVIIGDDSIWITLHRQMLWTLRSECLRVSDDPLEGLPTQDMLVIRELDRCRVEELSLGSGNEHEKTLDQLDNLRYLCISLNKMKNESLETLLYQTTIGGQVVIRGSLDWSVRAVILSLSNLLPIGCLRVNTNAHLYQHPNKFNLLGLPKDAIIPSWSTNCVVIDIDEGSGGNVDIGSIEGMSFNMIYRPSSMNSMNISSLPSIVQRYKDLLLDDGVSENVLEATIRSTRDHWLAKTKIIFQLMRLPKPHSLNKMLIMTRAKRRDRDVMLYWIRGLSKAYRSMPNTKYGNNIDQIGSEELP